MSGDRRRLGELQAQVMEVLWEAGDALTPREVLERLPEGPAVVYSTVMTVLRRLWLKGKLERDRRGRAYVYRPLVGREEHAADQMVELLTAAQDPQGALTHFVAGLSTSQRRQLRNLLQPRRR